MLFAMTRHVDCCDIVLGDRHFVPAHLASLRQPLYHHRGRSDSLQRKRCNNEPQEKASDESGHGSVTTFGPSSRFLTG